MSTTNDKIPVTTAGAPSVGVAAGAIGSVPLSLDIRLERNDSIPAFAGFLRCEQQHEGSHVIVLNVQACMAPDAEFEDGSTQRLTREDRKRLVITSLMHEFGHALEAHFRLPVNEVAIEGACEAWESAFDSQNT